VQGENLLHRQHFAEAAQAFQAALTRDPGSAQAWEGLGTAFASQGNIGKAIPLFLKALTLDSKRPWAALAIGEAYAQIGLQDKAQKLLKTAAQNEATRDSAQRVLQEMSGAAASAPLARYSHLSLQILRHPQDGGARKEHDALEKQLRASGELPPQEMMQPLLKGAVAL
jgi:tetratricopeptide (TPR) repeat protein